MRNPLLIMMMLVRLASAADDGVISTPAVTFEDGLRVELQKVQLSASITYRGAQYQLKTGLHDSFSRSSKTSSYWPYKIMSEVGGRPEHEVHQQTIWSTQAKVPALMLMLKAASAEGVPFVSQECLLNGQKRLVRRKNGVLTGFDSSTPKPGSSRDIPMRLQVTDGAGGWRDLDGPLAVDDRSGQLIASTHVFPRRIPKLSIRVLRPGHSPMSFTVKNPGYSLTIPSLIHDEVPAMKSDDEFQVGLNYLELNEKGGVISFRPMLFQKAATIPSQAVRYETAVYDASGNCYPEGRFRDRITPLPGEHVFRLVCRFEPVPSIYPWREENTEIIAEGRAGVSGGFPTAEITPAGRRHGFGAISFHASKEKDRALYAGQAWTFAFTIEGMNPGARDLQSTHVCLFTTSGNVQKEIDGPSPGTTSISLDLPTFFPSWRLTKFDLEYDWLGALQPGESFRVGLVTKKPVEFEFVVDLEKEWKRPIKVLNGARGFGSQDR